MRVKDKKDPRDWIISVANDIRLHLLSDFAGGNISLKVGEFVFMTPRYTGSRLHWRLTPKDIVVVDLRTKASLSRTHELSREARMHFALYEAFPDIGAVIHAHPFYSMVFACTETPIPPTAEYTRKLGVIPLTEPAPAHSQELAEAVVKAFTELRKNRQSIGLAVLIPQHGVVSVGRDLDEAFDILARVETSARIALYSCLITRR